MRLTRYQGHLEIWACRACAAETPLLDCHCCERRGVHLQHENPAGANDWGCAFCGHHKRQCGACGRGWLQDDGKGGQACASCGAADNR